MSSKNLTTHPAVQYLKALFNDHDWICLTFIHATKKYKSGGAVTENIFWPMADVVTDEKIAMMTRVNDEFHVFVSMAPFKGDSKNRTKANIAEARHVFVDADENGDAVLAAVRASVAECEIPAPTIVVQSSPHKYQFIWSVVGFTVAEAEAMNRTLQQKFNTDPQAVDAARVLRIAGFRNLKPKYGDSKPVAEIIEYNEPPFWGLTIHDFNIPMTVAPDNTVHPIASDAVVQQSIDFLEAAMNEASVSYTRKVWEGSGGAYKFLLALCPWRESHETGGVSDAMAIVQPSGAYGFKCLHAHCANKNWKDFRTHLESLAGHKLTFTSNGKPKTSEESSIAVMDEPEETAETAAITVPVVRPTLSERAFYGVTGDIVKKLAPQTEADPAGLLVELLVSLGNVMGRNPYIQVEDTRHYTNEFMVKVGRSSRARKGTGKNRIRAILKQVDPEWLLKCCESGIGSGEVIIHRMRDAREVWVFDKRKGSGDFVPADPGIPDKRLCITLGEFQGILAVCNRADSLLPVVLRDGWDGLPLHNTVKTDPAKCDEPMLSLVADTTSSDLGTSLSSADKTNGFANRFLWVYVDRAQMLPHGGEEIDWTTEAAPLRDAVEFAQQTRRVFMTHAAHDMWTRTMYIHLERDIPGQVGAITSRASAHVQRLAMIYALLDRSDHIGVEHLKAGEAVWQYCEDSAQAIFGDMLTPEQNQIIEFLAAHGASRKRGILHDCFHRNRRANLVQADLDYLVSRGRVTVKDVDEIPLYDVKK
jgi:hypothetical protein